MEAEVRKQRTAMQGLRHSPDMKLAEAINEYLDARVISQGTRQRETQALNTFVRGIGNKRLADLTPRALAEYIERRKLLLAPWTSYRETLWLRSRFQWFAEQWYIPANPVELVKVRVPHETRRRALSYDETRQLCAAASSRIIVRYLLAQDAGLALQEMSNLRRRHIDLQEKMIEVLPIKGRAHRAVPMTERLHRELAHRLAEVTDPDAKLVATRKENPRDPHSFVRHLRLRVPFTFTAHDLRHTFSTRLAAVAQRQRIVQYLMGHHPRTPTEKYDHPSLQDCRAAIAAMDAARRKGEQSA
ncbi:MAG: tyrosine-type recombinase/integrase, partial [Acidobacteria bacterium]|nr:tyrosine-type recombinase/integrase [Acidobacteriota bacterium]